MTASGLRRVLPPAGHKRGEPDVQPRLKPDVQGPDWSVC